MERDDALRWAVAAFHDKTNDTYHLYQRYLAGIHDLQFATEKFREAFGRIFSTFSYNLCETVVDAHADRMEITGFGSDDDDAIKQRRREATAAGIDDDRPGEQSRAQLMQDVWDRNGMDHREGQIEADRFGLGDAYVIADFVDREPVLWPAIPTEMRVAYSDQHPGKRTAAARLWGEGTLWRLNVWTETELVKYQARRNGKDDTSIPQKPEVFTLLDGQENVIPNPVPGIVPVFHFANNARVNDYGISELRNVIPLQNGLNKTVMDMLVAMEFAAFPQRVAIGIDDEDPDTQSAIRDLVTGVNRLITLQGSDGADPSIAEFSATNIAQYLAVIQQFEKNIAIVSKVPRNYFGDRNADAISGESKKMDESGFISKIEDSQRRDGQVWSELAAYVLTGMGVKTAPGDIRINWKPAAPMSMAEQLEAMMAKRTIGLPFEVILREAGYEPDQIADILAKKQAEDEAAADRQRALFDGGFISQAAD